MAAGAPPPPADGHSESILKRDWKGWMGLQRLHWPAITAVNTGVITAVITAGPLAEDFARSKGRS